MSEAPNEILATPDDQSRQNMTLHAVDTLIREIPDTKEQLGILIMACVLATRRVLMSHGIFDRGRRMFVLKQAVRDFDSKLREHAKLNSQQ